MTIPSIVFNDIDIDPAFDEDFYQKQYPDTNDYYSDIIDKISKKTRLYHHYIKYGQFNNPPYYKNLSELMLSLGMETKPPASFNVDMYERLYLNGHQYFNEYRDTIPKSHIIYHHYLNYGKSGGYAVNYDVIVFYHIPKCGGTTVHSGLMLPNLFRQYYLNTNYIYQISWIDNNQTTLFITIAYSDNLALLKELSLSTDTTHPIYNIYLQHNTKNLKIFHKYCHVLAITIKSAGFRRHSQYITDIVQHNTNRQYEQYTLLREPISLQSSTFYYLRDVGNWEKTHGIFDNGITFKEYINASEQLIKNWLIINLLNLPNDYTLTIGDAYSCIEKLEKFKLVGNLETFDNFANYLFNKYNWIDMRSDQLHHINKNTVSKKDKISDKNITKLKKQLKYDYFVYNHFVA